MKKVLSVGVVLVVLFVFSVLSIAQESAPSVLAPAGTEITGIYLCTGTNQEGRVYEQYTQIDQIGEVLRVVWSDGRGNISAWGVGFVDGDVFAVGISNPKSIGEVVYRYDSDKSLWIGTWAQSGSSGKYPENLKKIAELPSPTAPLEPAAPAKKAPLTLGPGIKVA